jgi:hypothetical protein
VALSLPEEAGLAAIAERKRPEDRTEEDKMAFLGRPRLGYITRAQIRIKESKEFKVRISANFSLFLFQGKSATKILCSNCTFNLDRDKKLILR